MNAIDVVRCCSRSFCNIDFGRFGEQKGYRISLLSSQSFLYDSHVNSSQLVLLIDNDFLENSQAMEVLKARVSETPYLSRICLWKNIHVNPDDSFVRLFDDFVFLPCCEDELNLRIKRYQYEDRVTQSSTKSDARLLLEFAPLKLHGESECFIRVLTLIKQISRFDAPVLVEGETGTGKENAARAIHYLGRRQNNAFIPINCGAMPDNLLESELFGYEKGAFTDAKSKNIGLLALAHQGTVFLDEVDSLSSKAQATLLRFLQTGEYRPLGSKTLHKSDVRIIAATNANLESKVSNGEFREDLFFRLNVFKLNMPPLRNRKQDIVYLARLLLKKYCCDYELQPKILHPRTLDWLQNQLWPGNVRQLENTVLRELLLNSEAEILIFGADKRDFYRDTRSTETNERKQLTLDEVACFQSAKSKAIALFEKEYVNNILELTAGNISEAARISGKERRAFGKLLKKYDIDRNQFLSQSTMV